jgi:autoinducer 2-degrading protein
MTGKPATADDQITMSRRTIMNEIAQIVEYEIKDGKQEAFEEILRVHAQKCLAEEAGCLRFEVLHPLDENGVPIPNRLMANELFRDRAALEEHRKTPRFERISEQFCLLLSNRRPIVSEKMPELP